MAKDKGIAELVGDGLWTNNQALVALLGLCPLLATTTSATNGLGMGLATTAVLVLANVTVSLIRNLVRPEVRLPVFVLVIASFVTAVELAMQAYFYALYQVLGLFIPLIVTNCLIIGRAEAFASKNRVDRALLDGIAMGIGFTLALTALGALRELIGQGTLFHHAHSAARRGRPRSRAIPRRRLPGRPHRDPAPGGLHRTRPADRPEERARPPLPTRAKTSTSHAGAGPRDILGLTPMRFEAPVPRGDRDFTAGCCRPDRRFSRQKKPLTKG